jgi:hypothetical protein
MSANGEPGRKTLAEEIADLCADVDTVRAWLKERGYGNALEAVAAEQTGPKLLTVGWSLARYSEIERDTVEEKICAHFNPDVSLWYHRGRGWCTPIKGRLEYLAENCEEAVKRFRQLTAET